MRDVAWNIYINVKSFVRIFCQKVFEVKIKLIKLYISRVMDPGHHLHPIIDENSTLHARSIPSKEHSLSPDKYFSGPR